MTSVFILKVAWIKHLSKNRRLFHENRKSEKFSLHVARFFSKNLDDCQAIKENWELRHKQENYWVLKLFFGIHGFFKSLLKIHQFSFKSTNGRKWQFSLWLCILFVMKTKVTEDFRIFYFTFCMWNEVFYVVYLEERYVLF